MNDVLTILSIAIVAMVLVYIFSRLQMRAWIHEIEKVLMDKYTKIKENEKGKN